MPRSKLYPTKYPNLKRNTKRAQPGAKYYGDFSVRGKRFRPCLGEDIETARHLLRERIGAEKRAGERMAPATLAHIQERFTEIHRSRVQNSTAKRWQVDDKAARAGLGGQTLLAHLSRSKIEEWIAARFAATSPASANRSLTRLRQVLSWAVSSDWLERDPTQGIRKYREPEERIRYLSADEEKNLRSVCTHEDFAWIEFAFLTGLRVSEQLQLHRSQVHSGAIWLEGQGTKNHRRRKIPVLGRVAAILERRPSSGLVWASPRGKVWSKTNFRKRFWLPLFQAAEIENFVWHDLRHTFCSRLVQKGVDLYRVCKLAGHRSITVTEKYAHLSPGDLVAALQVLEHRTTPEDDPPK